MERYDLFCNFIKEREAVRRCKDELGQPWPWSEDRVFDQTYFCNIRREDDPGTKWIRQNWPMKSISRHTVAMAIARWVNKPDTLGCLGYPHDGITDAWAENFKRTMEFKHKPWGGAYLVSTNGRPIPKHLHILACVRALEAREHQLRYRSLAAAHSGLTAFEGLGSFMAGQVVADLKNTDGHPLQDAPDWWTWSAHGPGSLRGLAWVLGTNKVGPAGYKSVMPRLVLDVNEAKLDVGGDLHAQDVQNCLCEFDKYCRVKFTDGRSKRIYRNGRDGKYGKAR